MAHPDTHIGCQTFQFLARSWCISLALELIATDPTAAEHTDQAAIDGLDQYLDLIPDEPHTLRLLVVNVDKDYAACADLTQPIIVVRYLTDAGDDIGLMVIDGWHRVYRARTEGRTHLPAYLLSPDAERAARFPTFPRAR